MKLTIKKDVLLTGLNKVYGVAEKNTTIAILSNVVLTASDGVLSLLSSDMVLEVSSKVPCDVENNGTTTVNAYTLHDIIKKLSNDNNITLTQDNGRLIIKSGKSIFKIGTLPIDDFPVMDDGIYNTELKLSKDDLHNLIDKVKHSVSTEEMRYYLNGICWHGDNGVLKAVSTDGHRLSVSSVETNIDELDSVIIPMKTCSIVSRTLDSEIGDIIVGIGENKIKFEFGETVVTSKLIDGKFPDYEKIIPKNNNSVVNLNSNDLINCIERVGSVLDAKTNAIAFEFKNDVLTISSNHDGNSAIDEISCESNNLELRIGFNAKYIRDALHGLGNNATISFKDDMTAITITPENKDDLLAVVMPLRV